MKTPFGIITTIYWLTFGGLALLCVFNNSVIWGIIFVFLFFYMDTLRSWIES